MYTLDCLDHFRKFCKEYFCLTVAICYTLSIGVIDCKNVKSNKINGDIRSKNIFLFF